MYVCMYVCVCMGVYVYICTCMYMFVYVCSVCMYVCYVCVCVCTYELFCFLGLRVDLFGCSILGTGHDARRGLQHAHAHATASNAVDAETAHPIPVPFFEPSLLTNPRYRGIPHTCTRHLHYCVCVWVCVCCWLPTCCKHVFRLCVRALCAVHAADVLSVRVFLDLIA